MASLLYSSVILPPIEECLFGQTRKCPKIAKLPSRIESDSIEPDSSREEEEEIATTTTTSTTPGSQMAPRRLAGSITEFMYDSFHLGHWVQAAQQHDIDLVQLRKIASQGIVDEGSYRGIAWRVLLNYLPHKDILESWSLQVQPKREFYHQLVMQYFQGTMESGRELRGQLTKTVRNRKPKKKLTRVDESKDDESALSTASSCDSSTVNEIEDLLPNKFKEQWKRSGITLDKLSTATSLTTAELRLNYLVVPLFDDDSPQEDFQEFMEDAMLLEEIRKDVARTLPHLLFFLEPNEDLGLRRYAALERILFLWAKLNKGVRYVQGMNEIAGTLYYVLANDHNADWADYAEEDTYFLFHALMMDIRDVFVPDMDAHTTGIQGRIENMQRLLQTHDPEVFDHLQACGIDAHFYAYRWLTTLLSREFLLPDTIRLWDSMFASTHKENFLRYVCVTMVMHVREDLLKGDFSSNLRLLQRYPPTNVDAILDSSRSLWMYETQIATMCHKNKISWQEALSTIKPPPSIIMAYGYKSGIAPNLQHRLENATDGLLGRAQRLLSGWSKDKENGSQIFESADHNSSAFMSSSFEPPPKTRFWNRSRRNTNDSEDSAEIAAAIDDPSTPRTPKVQVEGIALPSQSDGNKLETPASNQSSSSAPRRRIWNQSPASTRAQDGTPPNNGDVHTPEAEPLPNLQQAPSREQSNGSETSASNPGIARRFLWNRGGKSDETPATTT